MDREMSIQDLDSRFGLDLIETPLPISYSYNMPTETGNHNLYHPFDRFQPLATGLIRVSGKEPTEYLPRHEVGQE